MELLALALLAGCVAAALPLRLIALEADESLRGLVAPSFTGRTVEGDTASLDALRGRVVILNFWASWCEPCRPEMPQFDALHRELQSEGLTVLGLNAGEEEDAVRRFARELGLRFPLVLDPDGAIRSAYGVVGLPTTFVLDREGRVAARAIGPLDWAQPDVLEVLRAVLADPSPPAGPAPEARP